MKFFHRIEVWLLLLLAVGAAVWVLVMDSKDPTDGNPEAIAETAPAQAALAIHRTTLERDYGNARLDIELRYRNASPRTLILQPPDVRLLTSDGQEIPPFILPMEKPPQIAPQTAQDVRLRYWLDQAHLQGALTLDIRGANAEVKNAPALDLGSLKNREPKTWPGPVAAGVAK